MAETKLKEGNKRASVLLAIVTIVYVIFILPWFIEAYGGVWDPVYSLNGNLSYDLVNGKHLPIFSYQLAPHTFGPIAFPFFILAPLYMLFGEYHTLIGVVALLFATVGVLSWLLICKKTDLSTIAWFGLFAILAPPMFNHTIPRAWGTHSEAVALQSLELFLFASIIQKDFKDRLLLLIFGVLCGYSTFFLISNVVLLITVMLTWVILDYRSLIPKIPYFILGFIIGFLPFILRYTIHGRFDEFFYSYFPKKEQTFPLPSVKSYMSTLFKNLHCFLISPEFKRQSLSLAYILTALAGYFALLFNLLARKDKHLLPMIIYPVVLFAILSLTKRGEVLAHLGCSDEKRYFLPLFPICVFLTTYLIMNIYRKSKIIGLCVGVGFALGITLNEPSYIARFRSLMSVDSKTIFSLKIYRGINRYDYWADTLPNFAAKTHSFYLKYAKKAHDWERWLTYQQMGRWTYIHNPDRLAEPYNYAKSLGYEDFFLKGLGWGIVEETLLELHHEYLNVGLAPSLQQFLKDFETKFKLKTENIEFSIDDDWFRKGLVLGITYTLNSAYSISSIPKDYLIPLLDAILIKFPLKSKDKNEAIVEGCFWAYFWSPMECLITRDCALELSWMYERTTETDDYLYAVGKALGYGYMLRNFYIPKQILQNEKVKAGILDSFNRVGFRLGAEINGYVEVISPEYAGS